LIVYMQLKRGRGLETWVKVHTYTFLLLFCKTLLFGKFPRFVGYCSWYEQRSDENEYGAMVE
jgi:hypothetical protein